MLCIVQRDYCDFYAQILDKKIAEIAFFGIVCVFENLLKLDQFATRFGYQTRRRVRTREVSHSRPMSVGLISYRLTAVSEKAVPTNRTLAELWQIQAATCWTTNKYVISLAN